MGRFAAGMPSTIARTTTSITSVLKRHCRFEIDAEDPARIPCILSKYCRENTSSSSLQAKNSNPMIISKTYSLFTGFNRCDLDPTGNCDWFGTFDSPSRLSHLHPHRWGSRLCQALHLLRVILVYTKQPGKPPRPESALHHTGCSTYAVRRLLHKDFAPTSQIARNWGSARFDGQGRAPRPHPPRQDNVELSH
jgi:hypothetical protein